MQYKTQVFVYHEGDHYRTRLTHSLEVAQIARSISRALGLNEDLAEAVALAHDLGHTPFGHAGEEALSAAMAADGGFDHNEQSFRILTHLDGRYADFDGLNLTWETLEGVVKHNGPLIAPGGDPQKVPPSIAEYCKDFDLELSTHAGAEAQVAALADDIAYNNHDVDDGLRAGLFSIDDLGDVPLVGAVFRRVADDHPGIETPRLIHESVRRLIDLMVTDLLAETNQRLLATGAGSPADIRAQAAPVVAFSEQMRQNDRALKEFLFEHMYRHEKVKRVTGKARQVVQDLYAYYSASPKRLPPEWQAKYAGGGKAALARLVGDYIAGMTDRFAFADHEKLNNA